LVVGRAAGVIHTGELVVDGCDAEVDVQGRSSRTGGSFEIQGTVMVVIRLARGGAKKRPFFNIVVADSRTRRDGRFIERVGFYNPVASGAEQPLRVAFDRLEHWTSTGAQMSPTVQRLVAQAKAAV
jgi:small subunit ribosomal protein S16